MGRRHVSLDTDCAENRWDEKAGLRAGCGVRSQVIDVLEAQEIKETGNEEAYKYAIEKLQALDLIWAAPTAQNLFAGRPPD